MTTCSAFEEYLANRLAKKGKRSMAVIFNGSELAHIAERFDLSTNGARGILRSEGWRLGTSWSGSREVWYPPGSTLPYAPAKRALYRRLW